MRVAITSTYINLAKLFINQGKNISLRNLKNDKRMCKEACCRRLNSIIKEVYTDGNLSFLLKSIRNQKIAHNDATAAPGLIVNIWQLVDLSLCAYYFLDEYSTIAFNKHIAMPDTNLGPYLVESLAILDTDENVRQKCHDWCNEVRDYNHHIIQFCSWITREKNGEIEPLARGFRAISTEKKNQCNNE